MPEYLSQPDTYFILLSICGSLSLLVTSLIAFRFGNYHINRLSFRHFLGRS